jgi:septum formation protein
MDETLENKPLILASQSPRRYKLLKEAGVDFEAVKSEHEEPDPGEWRFDPTDFAQAAAYFKARSVGQYYPDRIILGADTIVVLHGQIYGKPVDRDDARRILLALTSHPHDVITGVALYYPLTSRRLIGYDITRITMRRMSDEELEKYLDSGEWEGKAGAYGIQESADAFVEKVEGSFSNVVGLPIELVLNMLQRFRSDQDNCCSKE